MEGLKWALLAEVSGRLQADFIKSHLEAEGILTELFQESVGQHAYPVTVDGLGRVQIFVRKSDLPAARKILEQHES
jgi:Putative prokaryotic signal transducing protein